MIRLLVNWLKKKLGYHVCEEFTQWERKKVTFTRPTAFEDGWVSLKHFTPIVRDFENVKI